MSLFIATSIAVFAVMVLHFGFVRAARAAVNQQPTIKRFGLLVGLSFLRNAAVIAAACFGGLLLLLWVVERAGIGFADGFARSFFDAVTTLRASVGSIGEWWGYILIAALAFALFQIVRRQTESRFKGKDEAALVAIIASERLRKTLRAGTPWFAYAGLALFFLSLLGVSGQRFADRLEDIVINRTAAQSEDELRFARDAAQRETSGENGDAEPFDSTLDQVARAFEDGLARARPFRPPGGGFGGPGPGPGQVDLSQLDESARLRSRNVREAILEIAERNAPTSAGLKRWTPYWKAPGVTELERKAFDLERRAVVEQGPVTQAGKAFRSRLAETFEALPASRRSAFIESVNSARLRPQPAIDAGARLAVEVFGAIFDAAIDTTMAEDLTRELFKGIAKQTLEPGIERAGQILTNRALARLLRGEDPAGLAGSVARDAEEMTIMSVRQANAFERAIAKAPSSADLYRKTSRYVPALRASLPTAGEKRATTIAKALVAQSKNSGDTLSAGRLADSLGTYGDFFPPRYAAETMTRRGAILASILGGQFKPPPDAGSPGVPGLPGGGGGGGGAPTGKPGVGGQSVTSSHYQRTATRARSFARLRGFARVGGVLIGREPELVEGERPDVVGLDWRQTSEGFVLLLEQRDGSSREIGPYPPSLVHPALAYAADGRQVTVTMTPAPPLRDLRILLHPVLLDTPVGCRTVEIDRFVDRFTERGPFAEGPIAKAERRAQTQLELFSAAQAAQVTALLEVLSETPGTSSQIERAQDRLSNLESRLAEIVYAGQEAAALDLEAAELDTIDDPDLSPLAGKRDFYASSVINDIKACRTSIDSKVFKECLAGQALPTRTLSIDKLLDRLEEVARPGPSTEFWSGVRERSYKLDGELRFLETPKGDSVDNGLWPFDFILQIAFDTEPLTTWAPEAVISDDVPWEFPSIAAEVEAAVWQGIRGTPDNDILRDMRNFTVLQRLFRAAFAGNLGADFPLAKLISLAEISVPTGGTPSPTPRWTPRPNDLEQLLNLRVLSLRLLADSLEFDSARVSWKEDFAEKAAACSSLIVESGNPSAIESGIWRERCTFEEFGKRAQSACLSGQDSWVCAAEALAEVSVLVAQARDLRESLNVRASENLGRDFDGCDPLQ